MQRLLALVLLSLAAPIITVTATHNTIGSRRIGTQIHDEASITLKPTTSKSTTAPPFIHTPPPVPGFQKRDFADICGIVSGSTLQCSSSHMSCVWGLDSGAFGCCPVDRSGYAVSSCTLPTACVGYAAWVLHHQTETPDPETISCTQLIRPYCQRTVLHGFVTWPNGLIEPGTWTEQGCATTTMTASGSIWTVESDFAADPDFDMLAQNMPMAPRPGSQVMGAAASWVVDDVPQPAGHTVNELPPSQRNLLNPKLSEFNDKNPDEFRFAIAASSDEDRQRQFRITQAQVDELWAQNMPMYPKDGNPAITFDLDPIRLNPDEQTLAISLFDYFWHGFSTSSSVATLHRRQDAEFQVGDEIPEILLLLNLYQLIALNLDYFEAARSIETYSGGELEVTLVTMTIPDGGFGPGFETVVKVTATPTATTTSAAEASQTCADERVVSVTLECAAALSGVSARFLWPVYVAMVMVITLCM